MSCLKCVKTDTLLEALIKAIQSDIGIRGVEDIVHRLMDIRDIKIVECAGCSLTNARETSVKLRNHGKVLCNDCNFRYENILKS